MKDIYWVIKRPTWHGQEYWTGSGWESWKYLRVHYLAKEGAVATLKRIRRYVPDAKLYKITEKLCI